MATLILRRDLNINYFTKRELKLWYLIALAIFLDICAQLLDLGVKTKVMNNNGLTTLRVAI